MLDAAPTVTIAGTDYALAGPLYDTQLWRTTPWRPRPWSSSPPTRPWKPLRAEGCIPDTQYLNVMYADNGKTAGENDAALDDIVAALQPRDMGGFERRAPRGTTPTRPLVAGHAHSHGERNASSSAGLRLMITYLALYIGFVFLISTAAILAIQQLSQASDSTPRYRILNGSSAATEA